MRLSELIADVREQASAQTANRWTDARIASYLNGQHRSIVRKTVETAQRYHNFTFTMLAATGRVKHTNLITYRLPSWVMKVAEVRFGTDTPSTASVGNMLPRRSQTSGRIGWELSSTGELELYGYSQGIDLELDVAKLPALLTKGTLPTPGAINSNQMRLDSDVSADAVNFPHESVRDAYAGAMFEITGPAGATKGQLLRCVSSLPNQGGGFVETLLTMEEPWTSPPVASNTYEMHAEIGTEHCRLLTLLAVRAMLASERNLNGLTAIAPELGEQWSLYMQHIQSRDLAGPHLVVASIHGGQAAYPFVYESELQ